MLDRAHRIVRGDEYRAVVRRGRRRTTPSAVLYSVAGTGATRFGFIVSKSVGNAVTRNRVRRRLKSIAAAHIGAEEAGATASPPRDIVIRALPGSRSTGWATLVADIGGALRADRDDGTTSRESRARG